MLYIERISLDDRINALTIACPDGIPNEEGVAVCNVTSDSSLPYFHIHFEEIINGVVTDEGIGIFRGRFDKKKNIRWYAVIPAQILKLLSNGARSYQWVFTMLLELNESDIPDFQSHPDEFLYDFLESYQHNYKRNKIHGELVTRFVIPYKDSPGKYQETYTCFAYFQGPNKEDHIEETFRLHGKTVLLPKPDYRRIKY